jgi:hypothetical protein
VSNTLAIATVTAALESRLTALVNREMTGFTVTSNHPGEEPAPGVYIKLFRIMPNAALRNVELPTRGRDGVAVQKPRLALNLHYLVSFVGLVKDYDAERLAGLVMTDLHATPTLSQAAIRTFIEGLPGDHPLKEADLGDQLERVHFSLLALDDEQLAKLWGLYNQQYYSLSVAYEASVVLLDAEVRPRAALPVASTGLYVFPTGLPHITRVRSSALDQPLVLLGQDLIVEGTNLRGPTTQLRIGGTSFPVASSQIGVDRITFPLTAALGLRAGVMSVAVVHAVDVDPDPAREDLRVSATSNAAPFALVAAVAPSAPAVTAVPDGHEIRLTVVPPPAAEQEFELLMDRPGGAGHASSTTWRMAGAAVVFTVTGLSAGDWLVRLRVDGATSGLQAGGTGAYASPAVTVP